MSRHYGRMAADWLKLYLQPVNFHVGATLGSPKPRDNRVHLRNGFVSSYVADENNIDVLTIDTDAGAAAYEPSGNTVPKRNGSGYVKNTGYLATSGGYGFASAQAVTRDEAVDASLNELSGTTWSLDVKKQPVALNPNVAWYTEIKPPAGSTLVEVTVVYTPATGHVGLPGPAEFPRINLFAVDDDGNATVVGTVQDTAASIAAYEVKRTLTLTVAVTVDPLTRYLAVFNSEQGANNVNGTTVHRPARWKVDYTTIVV